MVCTYVNGATNFSYSKVWSLDTWFIFPLYMVIKVGFLQLCLCIDFLTSLKFYLSFIKNSSIYSS